MKKTLCISILLFVLFANFAFGQQIAHLQQRYELLNWVNVRESPHGARGDGTTDDSIAFISACAAAINKILYVPPGTYKLSNDVTAGALVEVWFSNGVTLSVDNLKTFTISGKFHSPYIPTNIGLGTFTYSGATLPASPGGSDTQVQFNDGGITLGGDADLTWNKSTNVLTTTGVVKADSLKINDSDDSNTLEIKTTSNLTGDKALTLITGDADRTITLSGNPTISDWFDQAVKQASSPTFAALTLTNPLTLGNGGTSKALTASANKLVYSDSDSFELLDTGNSGVLVTSGAGVPSIATDIPTAVTIGTKYIYRAEGTDVPVTDGGTGASDTTNARSNLGLGTIAVLDSPLPTANGGTATSLDMFMGLYNRERSDKWQIKGRSTASDRYTLQSPAKLAVYLNSKVYTITAQTDYDLSLEATWDSIGTDYRVAATRAGVDFYVYACEQAGNVAKILVSANASAPTGYTTTTSRLIGGFHCLCLAVGTISGHALTDFATGDILPESIWDYNHRPVSSPAGMVFSEKANIWVDVYLASGTGANTASVFNGRISDTRDWMDFVDDGAAVKKRLLNDFQFQIIAAGSNEETNIFGTADPVTTGAHVDTASRRMISNIGVEDACGVMWQWLLDQSYRFDGGAHTHTLQVTYKASPTGVAVYKDQTETNLNAITGSATDETVESSSVSPELAFTYYNLSGGKGSLYRQGTYGDVKVLAGASWALGTNSGSRSRNATNYRWFTSTSIGGRFASEPLNR